MRVSFSEFPMVCAAIVILSFAIFSGCGSGDDSETDDPSKIGQAVEFSTVDADSHSRVESFRTVLIQDNESWAALWAEHKKNRVPVPDLPVVDFSQKMLVGVFLGFRPDACYSVNITSIRLLESQKVLVIYHEGTPSGNTACAAVVTYPSHIVSIEKSDLSVEFAAR